jgi:hypothetical protein
VRFLDVALTPPRRAGRRLVVARRSKTMDILYVAGMLGFVALSWGLVRLCRKVG